MDADVGRQAWLEVLGERPAPGQEGPGAPPAVAVFGPGPGPRFAASGGAAMPPPPPPIMALMRGSLKGFRSGARVFKYRSK